MPIFCDPEAKTAERLRDAAGGAGVIFTDLGALREHISVAFHEDTIVLGPRVGVREAFAIADYMRVHRPSLGVILVRDTVDTKVLQAALNAGVRAVVETDDVAGLLRAVENSARVAAAMRDQVPAPQSPTPKGRGRIITVFSAKGGCGKTTLATNLSVALAERGRRQVCLVDLDLSFGDVAIALQLFPAHTIRDAVPIAASLDSAAVAAMLTPHSTGLSALVAPVEPGSGESIPASLISRILEILREEFDYVVVDTPPAFTDQVLAAFDLSDLIVPIATLDVPALKNLKLTLETLAELNFPRDRWRVVINRADSKVGLTVAEVEKTLRTPIAAQIPSSRDVPAAINRGVPIYLDEPKHPVSLAIRTFAERQIAPTTPPQADRSPPAELRNERRSLIRKRRTRA